jgi:hypothetical protein
MVSLLIGACTPTAQRLPADPDVTFAAHRVHGGLMIDEMRGGEAGFLGPASWLRLPGEPIYVLTIGASRGEGLWLLGPADVVVRRTPSRDSAVVGAVEPTWENNAIRLALEPAGRPALRTGLFVREDIGGGMSVLGRNAQLSIEVPGVYRATLRDPDGRAVGWLRVAQEHHARPTRVGRIADEVIALGRTRRHAEVGGRGRSPVRRAGRDRANGDGEQQNVEIPESRLRAGVAESRLTDCGISRWKGRKYRFSSSL